MPQLSSTPNLLSFHTFGRDHLEPPAMPAHVQVGQSIHVDQMGAAGATTLQMQAGALPQDLDAIVRSIGEW